MKREDLPDLSKVEWDLMNRIWRGKRVTVADIHAHFLEERGWSHNTVKTMMQRLVKKGYLHRDDSSRAHVYQPAVSQKGVTKRRLGDTLDRILDDSFGPLIAYAAERKNLSDNDIVKLREILEAGADNE